MHDLDTPRKERKNSDRKVLIGGEEFLILASVRPEVLIEWEEIEPTASSEEYLRVVDELVVRLVEPTEDDPDPGARWMALRAREKDAISLGDMLRMVRTSVGIVSGRPTSPPLPSTAGAEGTPDSSTVTSPLVAVET